jgi:hypothetical protein
LSSQSQLVLVDSIPGGTISVNRSDSSRADHFIGRLIQSESIKAFTIDLGIDLRSQDEPLDAHQKQQNNQLQLSNQHEPI